MDRQDLFLRSHAKWRL